MIIAEFDSLEDANTWADADPYVEAGVYSVGCETSQTITSMTKAITFLVLLLGSEVLLAETVYTEILRVPLRDGQSVENRLIHRGLKSGVRLERLEINDESGYSKVRTKMVL